MLRTTAKPLDQKTIESLTTKLTESANKVVNFLESKLQTDGSFGKEAKDLACYFKSPMMFSVAGKDQCAISVLKYIETTFMKKDGDFKTSDKLKSENGAYAEFWSYTNGWIVRAAHKLGVKEIVERGNRYFGSYDLGDHRGFSTNQVTQESKVTDVLTIAHHSLINLEMGKVDDAIAAGKYLCQALTKQTDSAKGFYLRLDKEGNLITDSQTALHFVSKTDPNQLHFMIGYPAAYLTILYKHTQNPEFLNAAKAYLDFSLSCHESVYACEFSHKIAWAASLIYECTGDEKYLIVINKIAEHFTGLQQEDGMWFSGNIIKSYDQSAEIACWFLDIVKNINAFKKKLI